MFLSQLNPEQRQSAIADFSATRQRLERLRRDGPEPANDD